MGSFLSAAETLPAPDPLPATQWRGHIDGPRVATMKAPRSSLVAVMCALVVLTACTSSDEPETGSNSSGSGSESGLPNIALHEDGRTPITCDEWADLSDDIQHGLVFNALVKSGKAPATDAKVSRVRTVVDDECKVKPHLTAYEVAKTAALAE